MEMRGPGPGHFSGLSALTLTAGFPGPVPMIVCPCTSCVLLTSTTPSRQGAATQAAAVTGSRSLSFLVISAQAMRASKCIGRRPEHTSCFKPEPACSTARSGTGSSHGIPGSSTRQTQIRQWNERPPDPGDSGPQISRTMQAGQLHRIPPGRLHPLPGVRAGRPRNRNRAPRLAGSSS